MTSAGVAAGLDCCLYLLRRLCGAEAANRIVWRLVIAPHRQGSQAQFIEQPLPVSQRDDRLSKVLEWVSRHLNQPHSIDTLAQKAGFGSALSLRQHFRAALDTSPSAYRKQFGK